MKGKKIVILCMLLLVLLIMTSCSNILGTSDNMAPLEDKNIKNESYTESQNNPDDKHVDKIKIVTTLFPQYDFAKIVGANKVDVILLLPPGTEAHSYEPTPKDIKKIQNADLFLYTGEFMEPWAKKILDGVDNSELHIIDLSEGISLIESSESRHYHDHDHAHEHEHSDEYGDEYNHKKEHAEMEDVSGVDPHIWLNPINASIMVQNIANALAELSPLNQEYFQNNAKKYQDELYKLDKDFVDLFQYTQSHTIVSGGHFAFGYFVDRYKLDFESPYKGFAPDAEPNPKDVARLLDFIEENNVSAIYYEELVNPRVAKIIADETKIDMYKLHAAHNISSQEKEQGITYLQIMKNNMDSLKKGLKYKKK